MKRKTIFTCRKTNNFVLVQAINIENIKDSRYWPFFDKNHLGFPSQMTNAESVSLWSRPLQYLYFVSMKVKWQFFIFWKAYHNLQLIATILQCQCTDSILVVHRITFKRHFISVWNNSINPTVLIKMLSVPNLLLKGITGSTCITPVSGSTHVTGTPSPKKVHRACRSCSILWPWSVIGDAFGLQ